MGLFFWSLGALAVSFTSVISRTVSIIRRWGSGAPDGILEAIYGQHRRCGIEKQPAESSNTKLLLLIYLIP